MKLVSTKTRSEMIILVMDEESFSIKIQPIIREHAKLIRWHMIKYFHLTWNCCPHFSQVIMIPVLKRQRIETVWFHASFINHLHCLLVYGSITFRM